MVCKAVGANPSCSKPIPISNKPPRACSTVRPEIQSVAAGAIENTARPSMAAEKKRTRAPDRRLSDWPRAKKRLKVWVLLAVPGIGRVSASSLALESF